MHKSKSLTKGLLVLKEIITSKKPLTATLLCQKLSIDKSTMSRLISTLMQEGFMEYAEGSKDIVLSDFLNKTTQKEIREKIIAKTSRLLDEIFYLTDEATYLGVLENKSVLYLNQVDRSNRVLKTRNSIGLHAPLHSNAFGKILLAFEDIDLNSIELKKYTSNTITSTKKLQKEIDLIKQRGYAIGNEEHEFGLKSLAVAYFNNRQEFIGAIGISGLSARLDERTLNKFGQEIYRIL